MSRAPYSTVRIEAITGSTGWAPLRRELGIRSFGINAWTATTPGGELIEPHDEATTGHEELYIVARGQARFDIAGDTVELGAGAALFVRDPAAHRAAKALTAPTTVISVGAKPGEAFQPSAWEVYYEAGPLMQAGRFADARRLLTHALPEHRDSGALLLNLACAETRLGEFESALEHLRAGIALRPDLAASAATDEDLIPLRGDPRFVEIVGASSG